MEKLEYWFEKYPDSGAPAGQGILRNLGTPDLEKLELFTREIIQNCWDAADPDREDPVRVRIGCREIDDDVSRRIRSEIFPGARKELGLGSAFRKSPRLLTISDRNTHGLRGPTKAGAAAARYTDFVDFMRNVGAPQDKPMGGGSFGFGKAALYLTSLGRSIVVHSRAENEHGELETRLMAAGLSDRFTVEENGAARSCTGRHAWGVLADGEGGQFADPAKNSDCDRFIELLGLDGFGAEETGTDVVIVAPDLEVDGDEDSTGVSPRPGMDLIARCIAWHFWPKIYAPKPTMEISVECDGESVPIPGPNDSERLAAFVSAFFQIEGEQPPKTPFRAEASEIRSKKPARHLGDLVIQTHEIPRGKKAAPKIAAPDSDEPLGHVALMRNAELVVKYLAGPELPAGRGGYAGVFRVAKGDEELDQIFTDSEPPSHDDWVPKALEKGRGRTYVSVAMRNVQRAIDEYIGSEFPDDGEADQVALGQFSRELAWLIPSVPGEGGKRKPGSKGSSPASKAVIEVIRPLVPVETDGSVVLESGVRALEAARVEAAAVILADGSSVEQVPPVGAPVPEVLRWVGPSGQAVESSEVEMAKGEEWTVVVSSPGDSMVRVQFEVGE